MPADSGEVAVCSGARDRQEGRNEINSQGGSPMIRGLDYGSITDQQVMKATGGRAAGWPWWSGQCSAVFLQSTADDSSEIHGSL